MLACYRRINYLLLGTSFTWPFHYIVGGIKKEALLGYAVFAVDFTGLHMVLKTLTFQLKCPIVCMVLFLLRLQATRNGGKKG